MRIHTIIAAGALAALLTIVLPAAPAPAQATGDEAVVRSGLREIPKDRRAEAMAMLNAFKAETLALNGNIREAMDDIDAQFKVRPLNESRIRGLANELMGLRSSLYKKTLEFRLEFFKEFGVLPF